MSTTPSVDAFDLVIIGAGPGGYVAAIRGSQLGLRVALVERERLGGVCLNWGCIPTKALLRSAELYEQLRHLDAFGLACERPSFDFARIIGRSRALADQLASGIAFLMKKHRVAVIEGTALIRTHSGAPRVEVALRAGGSLELVAPNVILATGARARTLPGLGMAPDGGAIWTYREALAPKRQPQSLTVIGSGAIGLEFACFYRSLGTQVTVVEAVERILPAEDAEISDAAEAAFRKRGIDFKVGARVQRVVAARGGATVQLEHKGTHAELTSEAVLVSIGIDANVENIGLEALGVKVQNGHIVTDHNGATNVAGLHAIGDVAAAPWLAHKASRDAVRCVEHLAGKAAERGPAPIPACTYTAPQVASVGLTEAVAKARGAAVRVGRFPLRANGKALACGSSEGFVKTVFDAATGQLLGAHLIGAEVTELVHGFAVAMTMETTEAELINCVFPHPTISESMHEAVLDAYGMALHV